MSAAFLTPAPCHPERREGSAVHLWVAGRPMSRGFRDMGTTNPCRLRCSLVTDSSVAQHRRMLEQWCGRNLWGCLEHGETWGTRHGFLSLPERSRRVPKQSHRRTGFSRGGRHPHPSDGNRIMSGMPISMVTTAKSRSPSNPQPTAPQPFEGSMPGFACCQSPNSSSCSFG